MSAAPATAPTLPSWAQELIGLYESNAASQFILYGNVQDRMLIPGKQGTDLGGIRDFLLRAILPRFDVVLVYDLGNGLRVEKGQEKFGEWPRLKELPDLPRKPREAVEALTQYFRYCANLERLDAGRTHVACIIPSADLVAPSAGGPAYELSALTLLMREWGADSLLAQYPLATFLVTENLNDLHPLLATNPRAARIKIPLPSAAELAAALAFLAPRFPVSLAQFKDNLEPLARQFAGASLGAVESLLKIKEHRRESLTPADLVKLKKDLVEQDCQGLIEFIESSQTLEDIHGQETIKTWLRQDIALWKQNDLEALPMGYLLCGPVGTGKTFMVKCLAGEAGAPVVKLKNFRDKWVGSTEGNLEKIFRLLHALDRCFVFIDEADQTLGKRDSGGNDSGLSGRIYSMIAEEMSDPRNRGHILWILASSRPDLIEVDLKRPGRIDVKIPLFPTLAAEESARLLGALCKRRGIEVPAAALKAQEASMPLGLTPGAAEALAVKIYRLARTAKLAPAEALQACLQDYQNPVSREIMDFQVRLAVAEASDLDFVPLALRPKKDA